MQNLSYEDMRSALNHTSSNWRYGDNGEFCEGSRTTEKAIGKPSMGCSFHCPITIFMSLGLYTLSISGTTWRQHDRCWPRPGFVSDSDTVIHDKP